MCRRNGQLLIASLWMFTLFALLAGGLGFRSGLEAKIAFFDRKDLEDRLHIESILNAVTYLTDADPARSVDSPLDEWYNRPAFFQRSSLGEGARVTVEDEESKINLNFASEALLRALIDRIQLEQGLETEAEDLVASILAWRGESSLQGGPQIDWDQKRLPFESVAELLLIHDITDSDAAVLWKYVTAFAVPGQASVKVNLNTASAVVLAALIDSLAGDRLAKDDLFDRIEAYRRPEPGRVAVFEEEHLQPRSFIELLELPKTIQMISLVSQLALFVTTDSQLFGVHIELLEGERVTRDVRAVLGPKTVTALRGEVKGTPSSFAPALAVSEAPEVVAWYEAR